MLLTGSIIKDMQTIAVGADFGVECMTRYRKVRILLETTGLTVTFCEITSKAHQETLGLQAAA